MTPFTQGWDNACPAPKTILPKETAVEASKIYFYDLPGAKQSVIRIQRPAVSARDEDYGLLQSINFPLGGIYTSELNTELRVNKGYTYGIRSSFNGDGQRGSFNISTSVRSNVTFESLKLITDIVSNFGADYDGAAVSEMVSALIRGQALKNETLNDKLRVLGNISAYNYANDYQARNAEQLKSLTLEQMQALVGEHMLTDKMRYLVVGDAATAKISLL